MLAAKYQAQIQIQAATRELPTINVTESMPTSIAVEQR